MKKLLMCGVAVLAACSAFAVSVTCRKTFISGGSVTMDTTITETGTTIESVIEAKPLSKEYRFAGWIIPYVMVTNENGKSLSPMTNMTDRTEAIKDWNGRPRLQEVTDLMNQAALFRKWFGVDYRTAKLTKVSVSEEEKDVNIVIYPHFVKVSEDFIGDPSLQGVARMTFDPEALSGELGKEDVYGAFVGFEGLSPNYTWTTMHATGLSGASYNFSVGTTGNLKVCEILTGSQPTISFTGLPTGLKYDAKNHKLVGKCTKAGIFYPVMTVKTATGYTASAMVTIFVEGKGWKNPSWWRNLSCLNYNGETMLVGKDVFERLPSVAQIAEQTFLYNVEGLGYDAWKKAHEFFDKECLRVLSYKVTAKNLPAGLTCAFEEVQEWEKWINKKMEPVASYVIEGSPKKIGSSITTFNYVITYQDRKGTTKTTTLSLLANLVVAEEESYYIGTADSYGAAKSLTKSAIYKSGATVKLAATMKTGCEFMRWQPRDDGFDQGPEPLEYNPVSAVAEWFFTHYYVRPGLISDEIVQRSALSFALIPRSSPYVVITTCYNGKEVAVNNLTKSGESVPYGTVKGFGQYNFGKKVTLTATAGKNYTFAGWSTNNGAGDLVYEGDYRNPKFSFTMPERVSDTIYIYANFVDCWDVRHTSEQDEVLINGYGAKTLGVGLTSETAAVFETVTRVQTNNVGKTEAKWIAECLAKINKDLATGIPTNFVGFVTDAQVPSVYADKLAWSNYLAQVWADMPTDKEGNHYYIYNEEVVQEVPAFERSPENCVHDPIADGSTYVVAAGTPIEMLGFDIKSVSLPKVTIKGLPAGLKANLKTMEKMPSKDDEEQEEGMMPNAFGSYYTIEGVPTKAGTYPISIKVTTAENEKAEMEFNLQVVAMPDWAIGTFNGLVTVRTADAKEIWNEVEDFMYYGSEFAHQTMYRNVTNAYVSLGSKALHRLANLQVTVKNTGAIAGTVTYQGKAYKFNAKNLKSAVIRDSVRKAGVSGSAEDWSFNKYTSEKLAGDQNTYTNDTAELLALNIDWKQQSYEAATNKLAELLAEQAEVAATLEDAKTDIADTLGVFAATAAHNQDTAVEGVGTLYCTIDGFLVWEPYWKPRKWYRLPKEVIACDTCLNTYYKPLMELYASKTNAQVRLSRLEGGQPTADDGEPFAPYIDVEQSEIFLAAQAAENALRDLENAERAESNYLAAKGTKNWLDDDCFETVDPFVESYVAEATVTIDGKPVSFEFELVELYKTVNNLLDIKMLQEKTKNFEKSIKKTIKEQYEAIAKQAAVVDGCMAQSTFRNGVFEPRYIGIGTHIYSNYCGNAFAAFVAATNALYQDYLAGDLGAMEVLSKANVKIEELKSTYKSSIDGFVEEAVEKEVELFTYTNACDEAGFGFVGEAPAGWKTGATMGVLLPKLGEVSAQDLLLKAVLNQEIRLEKELLDQDAWVAIGFQDIIGKGYDYNYSFEKTSVSRTEKIAKKSVFEKTFKADAIKLTNLYWQYRELALPYLKDFSPNFADPEFTFKSFDKKGVAQFAVTTVNAKTGKTIKGTVKGQLQPLLPMNKALATKILDLLALWNKDDIKEFDVETGKLTVEIAKGETTTFELYGTLFLMPVTATAAGDYGLFPLFPLHAPDAEPETIYSIGTALDYLKKFDR